MLRHVLLVGLVLIARHADAEGLSPDRLGVIYNRSDRSSTDVARYYAEQRRVPASNVIGLPVPNSVASSDRSSRDRRVLVTA